MRGQNAHRKSSLGVDDCGGAIALIASTRVSRVLSPPQEPGLARLPLRPIRGESSILVQLHRSYRLVHLGLFRRHY
eukprot:scaffold8005_cov275-Amphora_coffeaeformis.AAC.41